MNVNTKISIKNLYKSFGNKHVLKGLDLEVKKGESLVILGLSGSGKSVLIKAVSTLLTPDSGSIEIDGENILAYSKKQREKLMDKFGFLFQGGALFDSLNIWENVAFRPLQKKMSKTQAKELAEQKLKEVGLDNTVLNLYPNELSGGMQKRVALARAVISEPEIIFFDEPTTGLDPITSDLINELIIRCSKKIGATTISITHDISSAKAIADKVAMLYDGEIVWIGEASKIYSSGNPMLDQFVNGKYDGPIDVIVNKL